MTTTTERDFQRWLTSAREHIARGYEILLLLNWSRQDDELEAVLVQLEAAGEALNRLLETAQDEGGYRA